MNSCAGLEDYGGAVKALPNLEMERAASHEAGHAVASVYLGVPFAYVQIVPDGTGVVYLPENLDISPSELTVLARNQVIVAYAGPAAQRMFYPDQPEHEILQCSEDDRNKIRLISADFPEVEIGKQAEATAKAIVEKLRDVVRKTAERLVKGEKLNYEDVRNIHAVTKRESEI
jgi:ATP-dependent Zn protease